MQFFGPLLLWRWDTKIHVCVPYVSLALCICPRRHCNLIFLPTTLRKDYQIHTTGVFLEGPGQIWIYEQNWSKVNELSWKSNVLLITSYNSWGRITKFILSQDVVYQKKANINLKMWAKSVRGQRSMNFSCMKNTVLSITSYLSCRVTKLEL